MVKKNGTYYRTILPAILLLGFAVRLYKLGAPSLWYDETVSAFLASQSPSELVAHTARDIHPPLYYLLLHYWAAIAGQTEFGLAFLSLIFGLLLIPLTYRLARYLSNSSVAIWAAVIISVSPYNIWYSQEVRMYTLAAFLGLLAAYCGLRALADTLRPGNFLWWLGYLAATVAGLYTLYYFAFLLIILNLLFLIYTLRPKFKGVTFGSLLVANSLLLLAYLPWLPVAWRQATNPPVPSWRSFAGLTLWSILLESWSALSFGQSVQPATFWPMLLLTLALAVAGLLLLRRTPLLPDAPVPPLSTSFFLLSYTFGPLLLIYLFSFVTPLYHVRYIFAYSPGFYILLGAGMVWLTGRSNRMAAVVALLMLLTGSLYSIYQYHFNPRYRTDDYRTAVEFIQQRWQPGDAILVNAGYVYTAFAYYTDWSDLARRRLAPYQSPTDPNQPILFQAGTVDGGPELGWGDPRADFYGMNKSETAEALQKMSQDFNRLWLLRAYDTVTDPESFIRIWLAEHTIPIEDRLISGESSIRAQGFLLGQTPPVSTEPIKFEDGMALVDWELPDRSWQPGQTIHLKLWWMATALPSVDYKMSLKLWSPSGKLAAQGRDEWPVGTLYRATAWPVGQPVYHATPLILPPDLSPGEYWLNVELYHPDTISPLARLDNGEYAVTLGPVIVR